MVPSDWSTLRKDVATSADLGDSGKAPPATAAPKLKPEDELAPELPAVQEAKCEEVSLPRTKSCECKVEKCACQVVQKPIPAPVEDEAQDAFMSRCMGDAVMNSEYPDQAQRAAICHTKWGERGVQKAEISMQLGAPSKTIEVSGGEEPHANSVMLALWMPSGLAKSIAVDGGEPADDMHVTLGYFGKVGRDLSPEQSDLIYKCASKSAQAGAPIKGRISGIGRFTATHTSDHKDVMYASLDAPGLGKFRHGLMEEIHKCANIMKSEIHDFTPHVTLKYLAHDEPSPIHRIDHHEVQFAHLVMAVGKERRPIPLGEVEQMYKAVCEIVKSEQRLVTGIVLQPEAVDAQGDIIGEQAIADAAHAFVANYNNRTKIGVQHTVPAGSAPEMFPKGVHLVESYVCPVDLILNGRHVKKGTWIMTVFVEDDVIWERVKAGKIRGLSIGGIAKVQRLAA